MAVGNYIEAVEIIRRLEGGITRPFLCRASNDKHYVTKGLELPPSERIAELLCARLAAQFGLPIPEHGYIYIDPALLRYNLEARNDLGPGDSYALAYVATLPTCCTHKHSRFRVTCKKPFLSLITG
jgi:hypothetical protein